jgi:hypothetical protein
LFNLTYGNPLVLNPSLVDKNVNPIIYNIAVSFVKFGKEFFSSDDNYKKSPVLFNPLIQRARNDKGLLDVNFFRQNPQIDLEKLAKIRFRDIFSSRPLQLEVINANPELNLNLNLVVYLRLMGACSYFFNNLKQTRVSDGSSLCLRDYFRSVKKGSKGIRKICNKSRKKLEIKKVPSVKTYLRITNIDDADCSNLKLLYGIWSNFNVNNRVRDFAYKFCNNLLGINTRLSHFVLERARTCSFCQIAGENFNVNDETFLHLFYECDQLVGIRSKFYNKYFIDLGNDAETKHKFWFGILPVNVKDKFFCILSMLLIQFGIWCAKQKGLKPSFVKINLDLLFSLKTVWERDNMICSNDPLFALSRDWHFFNRDGIH